MTDASADEELQAWREVHDHLSKAVLVTTEAVAVAKAERRYLVEEIFVNLTPDGKLSNTSVWKKSGKNTRKPAAKRKPTGNTAAAAKRRRKEEDNQAVNWQNVLGFGLPGPQHDVPILPNDAAGVAFAELYAAGDQINTAGIEDCPPAMMMSPMQAAQQSGGTAGFHPPGSFMGRGKVLPPMRGKVLPQMRGKVLPPTMGMAPYAAAQAHTHVSPVPVPNATPMGAYASVLQGGGDSDTASDDDDE